MGLACCWEFGCIDTSVALRRCGLGCTGSSVLQQRLVDLEAGSGRELGCLRLRYEAELADARRALDDIAIERATLQVELGKIGEEHRQLHSRSVSGPSAWPCLVRGSLGGTNRSGARRSR